MNLSRSNPTVHILTAVLKNKVNNASSPFVLLAAFSMHSNKLLCHLLTLALLRPMQGKLAEPEE